MVQLGHVPEGVGEAEFHAVQPGDECQWHQDGGNDGEYPDDVVHFLRTTVPVSASRPGNEMSLAGEYRQFFEMNQQTHQFAPVGSGVHFPMKASFRFRFFPFFSLNGQPASGKGIRTFLTFYDGDKNSRAKLPGRCNDFPG